MTLWLVNLLRNLKVNAKNLASLPIKATTMKKIMCKHRELWLLSVKYMTLSGGLVCRYCEKSPTAGEKMSVQPVSVTFHDNVIKWKHFPRYWPFVRGTHRSPVNSPHKGQWRGALMFSLICVWINGWVNNGEACDLRRYRAYYDVTVMRWQNCKTQLKVTHVCRNYICYTCSILQRVGIWWTTTESATSSLATYLSYHLISYIDIYTVGWCLVIHIRTI